MARAEEALRLLNIKRVRLLKDNAMVRAALVIDYLSRNATTYQEPTASQYFQTIIPISMLADTIGFNNKKDRNKLQSMQTVIASYLDGTSIDQRKKVSERNDFTQNHSRKRNHSDTEPILGQSDATTVDGTKTTMIKPTSLVKQLCIQLGTMISDAEFVNSHALQLFREVQRATTTASAATDTKRSKYQLYKDIERNQVYYEAACFYLAVMKSESGSHVLIRENNKKSSIERRKDTKPRKKGNQLHNDMDDNDMEEYQHGFEEERPLNELDVIREANLLEGTFRTILAFVHNSTKDGDMNQRSSNIGDGRGASTNGLFELPGENGRVAGNQDLRKSNSHCNALFEVWKERVLHQAKMSVQEQMKDGDSEGDWLSLAAEEVLGQAGLM